MKAFKHLNQAELLLSMMASASADWIVEVIDPAQSGRAVVERVKFHYTQKRKAQNYIKKQRSIDPWNKYELVRESIKRD